MQHKIGDRVTYIYGLGDQSAIPFRQAAEIWRNSRNKLVGVVVASRVTANKQEVYDIQHETAGIVYDIYLPFTRK